MPCRHAPQCRRQLRFSAVRAQCALVGVPQYPAKAVPLVACLSQIPDYPLDTRDVGRALYLCSNFEAAGLLGKTDLRALELLALNFDPRLAAILDVYVQHNML